MDFLWEIVILNCKNYRSILQSLVKYLESNIDFVPTLIIKHKRTYKKLPNKGDREAILLKKESEMIDIHNRVLNAVADTPKYRTEES